jgi:hypothetical protein
MAQLTIQMLQHPQGGKTYRISLVSEEDATPREHEQDHRKAIQALLPHVNLDEPGPRVTIERERPAEPPPPCSCGDDDGYEVIDLD